ncbi:hypothetical protein [Malonomonas rubra]|nr:hypothetical protein [Malonomonas rubra]
MDTHLMSLLDDGRTTPRESYRCAVEKSTFESKLPPDEQAE